MPASGTTTAASHDDARTGSRLAASASWRAVEAVLTCATSLAPSEGGLHLVLALVQRFALPSDSQRTAVAMRCGGIASEGAACAASHGSAWGFARVVRLEHPSLVMVSVGASSACAAMTTRSTTLGLGVEGEPETCWRFGRPFASR